MKRKQIIKKLDGKCYFCGESDYSLLDAHRILPGCEGGKYSKYNTLTTCSNCHRKIHAGRIIIHGRHFCTNGKDVIHYTEDGEEKWA